MTTKTLTISNEEFAALNIAEKNVYGDFANIVTVVLVAKTIWHVRAVRSSDYNVHDGTQTIARITKKSADADWKVKVSSDEIQF